MCLHYDSGHYDSGGSLSTRLHKANNHMDVLSVGKSKAEEPWQIGGKHWHQQPLWNAIDGFTLAK